MAQKRYMLVYRKISPEDVEHKQQWKWISVASPATFTDAIPKEADKSPYYQSMRGALINKSH